MDLSKAFDTVNHKQLLVKLHPYDFSSEALKVKQSYLLQRKHQTKVNGSFSNWRDFY